MAIFQILQTEWAIRALSASAMVGMMCGMLGCFIVLRNMALIGDALSHAVLPGVVVAFMLVGFSTVGFFIGSVAAGLLSAAAMTWIQQHVQTKNDAAIGIVFTAMFSAGVMGISWISHQQGVHLDLKDFLFGNVLGVSNSDLYLTTFVSCFVLISIITFYRYLFISTFQPIVARTMGISVQSIHYFLMLLLSFSVVASLQTVGVILVVAMLITPASTALLLSNRLNKVLITAGILGFFAAIIGFIAAVVFETTPGPAMVMISTLMYVIAMLFAPKKGLISRFFQKRSLENKIRLEDTLKRAWKLQEKDVFNFENLAEQVSFPATDLKIVLSKMMRNQLIINENHQLKLTNTGIAAAIRLVRAHRLWETYLARELGLTQEQIHEDAEKYEHLLSDELLDEVDAHLDFPEADPHGSPIPKKD
jgi:ABC-type Mn2+/Zn2+ transport system permease subunit/Mn-dependent DtxR family transcriptional regulator